MDMKYYLYKLLKSLKLISKEEFLKKTEKYSRVYKLVSRSKLFDAKWYLTEYPEIKSTQLTPLEHYIKHGFKEDKKPSKSFSFENNFTKVQPNFFYALYDRKNRSAYEIPHKNENKLSSFVITKRKILLFSHEFSRSGAPRALLNLAKELQKKGLEPVVLSPSFGELEKEYEKNSIEYYIEPLLMLKLLFKDPTTLNFFNSFDCIFFNSIINYDYANYIVTKAKLMLWVHETENGFPQDKINELASTLSLFDEIYAVSAYAKSFVNRYLADNKSSVLTLCLDDFSSIAKWNTDDKIKFLTVGYISSIKGHDLLIEAIKQLPVTIKNNCEFNIIGKFDKSSFAKNIHSQCLKEDIHILGELSYEDMLEKMNEMHVILCPSRSESLSMGCIEGMMLKKCVLCSSTTGVSSYIENKVNGYVYDFYEDTLKDAIEALYQNKQSLEVIGEKAQEIYFENFTQEKFSKEVERIFGFLC